MIMAKVVGNVWTTQKEVGMDNLKLLVVQPLDMKLIPYGSEIVTVDRIGAGNDDLVLVTQGSPAQKLMTDKMPPIDAAVVGIVDSYDIEKKGN